MKEGESKLEKEMDNTVGVMLGHERENMKKLYKLEKVRRQIFP